MTNILDCSRPQATSPSSGWIHRSAMAANSFFPAYARTGRMRVHTEKLVVCENAGDDTGREMAMWRTG